MKGEYAAGWRRPGVWVKILLNVGPRFDRGHFIKGLLLLWRRGPFEAP